jgi:hypothetical protein
MGYKYVLGLIVFMRLVREYLAGVIQPEVADSVLPYRNNENAIGKYTFTMKLSTAIPSSPRITIDFPDIYPKLIANVDNCLGSVEVRLRNEVFELPCQINGRQVIFDISSKWSEVDAGNVIVQVYDIINPPGVAGKSTGYFGIKTWSGIDIVIDSNLSFESINFAPAYTNLASAVLVNDGANIAGYTTNYILTFQTAFVYPKGSWFRFKYPDGFKFALPLDCYITDLPVATAYLDCKTDGQTVIMRDLKQDLPIGTFKLKMRNIINPTTATPLTLPFQFESLKEDVYTVIEYHDTISGVTIASGTVTDVSVIGFPLVANLFVDYTIKFRPSNFVPKGGVVNLQFPTNFVGGLDSTCRVVSGLTEATVAGLKCYTVGLHIYIENFLDFIPQYITVKCFAYNPPVAGETLNFQVRTFTTLAKTQKIDENVMAGTVVISTIQKPNFMEIDFYKKHVNCSHFTMCPINYRYFPIPGNELKRTTMPLVPTNFGMISIQIPIWWALGGVNNIPECLFGDLPAASCNQREHFIQAYNPTTKDYGDCELPNTIKDVRVTPIPGRFPFRILTFIDGNKYTYYSTPKEQDTYIMDIPITSIAVLQTWSSGYESEDADNLLHIRANVHPFLFAWSGTISITVTHIEDSLEDRAEWNRYVGIPSVVDSSYKEIPCRLFRSGTAQGYYATWLNGREQKCVVRTGDYTIKEPLVIQITGLYINVEKGEYFDVYIPDIQFCKTIGRQCKVTYSYTMTEDLKFPYTISRKEQTIAVVQNKEVPATLIPAVGAGWGVATRSNNNRCRNTDLNFNIRIRGPLEIGDYVVVKRHIDHWNEFFFRTTYGGFVSTATTGFWVGVRYKELNFEYLIMRILTRVTAASYPMNVGCRINNFVTSPYENNQAHISYAFWSNHLKNSRGPMTSTAVTTTGFGIWNNATPDLEDVWGMAGQARIANWYAPMRINIGICKELPSTGEIILQYLPNTSPTNHATVAGRYSVTPNYCRVWNTVRKIQSNETHVSCRYDNALNRWVIKDFDALLWNTNFRVNWYVNHTTTIAAGQIYMTSYNVSGNPASVSEWFNHAALNGAFNTLPTYGTGARAISWSGMRHYEYTYELYENGRSKFVFEIEVGHAMAWNFAENNYFIFILDISVTIPNNIECRYALKTAGVWGHHYPSVECVQIAATATQRTIRMKMHPYLDILANSRYQIFIDTRDVDLADGLQFTRAGIYTINVESYVGGVRQRVQKQRYEVFAPRIPHFLIRTSNKIVGEQAVYTFWLDFINNFGYGSSDPLLASFTNIMLYFETANNGFLQDIGTGYADQSDIPCNLLLGVPFRVGISTAICTIYYGYSNAPARIKIQGYNGFNARVIRIDIPKIINPITPGIVPRAWVKIQQTTTALGIKTTTNLREGRFYELNTTWTRNITRYPYVALTQATVPTHNAAGQRLDTVGLLRFTFATPQTLHGNGFVLIKFPIFWPTPYIIDPTTCLVSSAAHLHQERCYTIRNDNYDEHYLYFELQPTFTLANGAILSFEVPSSRAVVPNNATTTFFEHSVFHDGRLISRVRHNLASPMFIPDPIVATVNCLPVNPVEYTATEYLVRFTLPHNLLVKSEIRIDYPFYDLTPDLNCTSTTTSQLAGPLTCSLTAAPFTFSSTVGFDAIPANRIVELKIPLLNQAAAGIRQWRVRTYYLRGGYYYVNGEAPLFNHVAPACTVVASAPPLGVPWNTWFHKFQRTRTGSFGPIVFHFESKVTLAQSTIGDYVLVKIPLAFTFRPAEKVAMWDDHYPYLWEFRTDATHHLIKVWAPKTVDVTLNTRYTLNITTLNGLQNINGLLHPAQGTYLAQIEVYKANALVEVGTTPIFVFAPNLPRFECASYLMNAGFKASFRCLLTVPTTTTYTAQKAFTFKLPTATYKYMQRIRLFPDDGGSGLANNAPINCHLWLQSSMGDLGASCTLVKGSQDFGTPASVHMTLSSTLTANLVYVAVFDQFVHPAVGDDDKNVEPSIEWYNTGGVLQRTGIDYDYTIVTDTNYDTLSNYPAPNWDSLKVGQTLITFRITFQTPPAPTLGRFQTANGQGWTDYLILEFPDGYILNYNPSTIGRLTAGPGSPSILPYQKMEFSKGNRWLIYRIDLTTLTAGASYTLQVENINQAVSISANPSMRMLIVQDRSLRRVINYLPTGLQPNDIVTPNLSLLGNEPTVGPFIPTNKYQQWVLTFNHANMPLPRGAMVEITLPIQFVNIDDHCYNAPTSQLLPQPSDITPYCKFDTLTNSYLIKNIESSPITDVFRILFYAQAVASPGAVIITIYQDENKAYTLLRGSTAGITLNPHSGFNQLMVNPDINQTPDAVRALESNYFEFYYSIPTGYTATSTITVTFPLGVSVPAGSYIECFFGLAESRECLVLVASPLSIRILPPHTPTLAVASRQKISIRTRCSAAAQNGLVFSTAGEFFAVVTDGTTTQNVYYQIFFPNFDMISTRVMHSNQNMLNGITVRFKTNVAIPVGGSILIKFPRQSIDGIYQVWKSFALTNSMITGRCVSANPTDLAPIGPDLLCEYYEDEYNNVFKITGFAAVPSGNTPEIVLQDILNTATTLETLHVDMVVETRNAANTVLNQGLHLDVFTFINPTMSGVTSTATATGGTGTNLGQTNARFTFPNSAFTGIPATEPITRFDQVVFEFSDMFNFNMPLTNYNVAPCNTLGTWKGYGKYVVFKPTADISTAVTPVFCFDNGKNAPGVSPPAERITARIISSRGTRRSFTFPPKVLTLSTATISQTISSLSTSASSIHSVTIDPLGTIPAGGCIAFQFPTTFVVHAAAARSGVPVGTTVTIDLSVAGFQIIYLTFPVVYTKALYGNLVVDVYLTNPTTAGSRTVSAIAYAKYSLQARIWVNTYNAAIVATPAITCSLDGPSAFSLMASSSLAINVLTPALITPTFNSKSTVGYDMLSVASTSTCSGLPVYVSPAPTLGGAPSIVLAHRTINKPNLFNLVTIRGTVPNALTLGGTIAVDFGNHDMNNLGYTGVDGSYIPCQLKVNTVLVESICKVKFGNFYRSPGIRMQIFAPVASGSTIEVLVSKFRNPATARIVEVRLRYYEGIFGDREEDLFSYRTQFTIADNPSFASSAATVTLATAQAQTVLAGPTNFVMNALDVGNNVVIFSPADFGNKLVYPATTGIDSADYHASAFSSSAIAAATISLMNFELPVYSTALAPFHAVSIDPVTFQATRVITFTPSASIATCTMTAVTYTAISKNDATGFASYRVSFTSPCAFTRGSDVRLKLATYLSGYSLGNWKLTSGTPAGPLYISADTNYLYIHGYNYMPAGTYTFDMSVYGVYAAGASTGEFRSLIFNSYSIVNDATTCAPLATNSAFTANKFRPYINNWKRTVINTSGYLSFYYQASVASLSASDIIRITPPATALPSFPTGFFRCKFTDLALPENSYLANSCTYDTVSNFIQISLPNSQNAAGPIVANKVYKLDIFQVSEISFGYQYPSSPTDYQMEVSLLTNTFAFRERFITNWRVAQSGPTATCFRNMLSNNGYKNVFLMRFNPAITIPSSGFLEFHFPTTVINLGVVRPSFDRILGMTEFNAQAIKCRAYTVVGVTKTPWAGVTRCVVDYGGFNQIHRAAIVRVILNANMAAGTTYQVDIFGVDNPTLPNINSYAVMYSGATAVKSYLNVHFDETQVWTTNPAILTEAAQTLPVIAPNVIQSLTNFNLNVNTAAPLSLETEIDHLRIVYNPDMNNKIAPGFSATNFEAFDVLPGLGFLYQKTTKTTNFVLNLFNMLTPASAKTFVSAFSVQVIDQKVIKSHVPYNTGTSTFVAIPYTTAVIPPIGKTISASSPFSTRIDLTLSKILSKTGSINIFTNNIASLDPICSEASAVIGKGFVCQQVSPTMLRVSGLANDLPVGTVISITLKGTASALTTGTLCSTAFNDNPTIPTAQVEPVQLQTCDTFTYTSTAGITWWEARTNTDLRIVQAKEWGMMTFKFDLTTTIPMNTGYVTLTSTGTNFQNLLTKDYECFFGDRVARRCIYSGGIWTIFAPRSNNLVPGKVTLTVTTLRQDFVSGATRVEGVLMPTLGAFYPMTLRGYNTANTLIFTSAQTQVDLPVAHFTLLYFNSYLVMRDTYTTFHLDIRPETAIPAAPGGVIKIDFKVKNRYALNVFNPDLGTGQLNGQPYSCPASAPGGFVTNCKLFTGNAATPASIIIEPAANMVVGTTYGIDFPALLSPLLNMTEVIIVITSQSIAGSVRTNLNYRHDDIFVAMEQIVTPVPLPAENWGTRLTGAPYPVTYSFTMNPAYGPIKPAATSFDKIVMKFSKAEIDILNDQALVGRVLACPGYTIKIFDNKDLIELTPTAVGGIPAGSTVNLAFTNFLHQQYVIRGGLQRTIELWIDGQIAEAFQYGVVNAVPNILTVKTAVSNAITPETLSFDTYTFTMKPYNYMPVGSYFTITFSDTFSGLTNCEIVSGLNGGVCILQENVGGVDSIIIKNFLLWNPLTDANIVIRLDMTNTPTAGTYPFTFTSYWQELPLTPLLEDLIDQDVIGTFTYIGGTPFNYLALDKMYEFGAEVCPGTNWEGRVSFKVQLQTQIDYPDYIIIQNWDITNFEGWEREQTAPFITGKHLCYFDRDNILFSAMSENCPVVAGQLWIMVPEELPLMPTNTYTIHVDSVGQWQRGYWHGTQVEYKKFNYIFGRHHPPPIAVAAQATNTVTADTAPLEWFPRACYFGQRWYTSTNWHESKKHSIEIVDSIGDITRNFKYSGGVGNRPRVRFQVSMSSHNEIKAVNRAELGFDLLTTPNATGFLPSRYFHDDTSLNNPNFINDQVEEGLVFNVNPSYADWRSRFVVVTTENITNTNTNQIDFRYGWAGITNHIITPMATPLGPFTDGNRNTFSHMHVQSQTEIEDGQWIDSHRVIKWYHKNIHPFLNDATITTNLNGPVTMSTRNFGEMHTTWYCDFRADANTVGGTVFAYWEFEDPWWHLPRNLTHGSRWCRYQPGNTVDNYCMTYGIPFRWSLFRIPGHAAGSSHQLSHFGLIESPSFSITKPIKLYVASGGFMNYIKDGTATINTLSHHFIFEMDERDNPEGANLLYRIAVWHSGTYENYTNYVRLWITNDFQTIGPECKIIFGFQRPDMDFLAPANSPTCTLTPNDPSAQSPTPGQYHRAEFHNIRRYSRRWFDQYESWMIFEIRLQNPAVPKWPRPSGFQGYDSNTPYPTINTTRINYHIRPSDDKGRSWVGANVPVANYFRVVRNRLTYEERRQKAGEWAELHMRLYPLNVYPADISKVEIQIPASYDIPNGGENVCEVGHLNHVDLEGQFCEISNERKIQVRTSKAFGLLQRCTIVRITTDKSVKNNNGFQAPPTVASEAFETNLYVGSTRIEYTSAKAAPEPTKLVNTQTLNFTANVIELLTESTLEVSFHSGRSVRAGYDTDVLVTDIFLKKPQGVIYLKFNTRDKYTGFRVGFNRDLGYLNPPNPGGNLPFDVPCVPFKGLKAREGESLKCTMYPSLADDFYVPTEMRITNFEFIGENVQFCQVHITQMYWTRDSLNLGWIEFSIYEKYGDGSLQKIYDDVRVNMGGLPALGTGIVVYNALDPYNPTFSPNTVGSRQSLTIKFRVTVPLYQYDHIEVTFPNMIILPEVTEISAVFKVTPVNILIPPYNVAADIVVYKNINRVNFIIPRTLAIYGCTLAQACNVQIATAGFRHAPYVVPGTLTFFVRITNKQQVIARSSYNQVPPPIVAPFNSILVTMNSQFSEDIYVKYDFSFTPSYFYPAGSTIVITLSPVYFSHIDKSNPPAECETNFASITSNCVIGTATITVTLNGELAEGYSAVITAKGVKNPTLVGQTLGTDITITSYHPTGNKINENTANVLNYKPKKNIDTIIFRTELSSLYSEVSSEYKFSIQNTNRLPPKGILNIQMPKNWSKLIRSEGEIEVSSLSGGFTKSKLLYTSLVIRQPDESILLQIIPDFEWPSKEKLIINLKSLINPKGITLSDPFLVSTQYDSVTIDESDPTDPASTITLKPYNPKIKVWMADFTPKNEAEIATYTMIISSQIEIKQGEHIQFIFPPTFTDILTVFSLKVKCKSSNTAIGECTAKGGRSLTIPINQVVKPDVQMAFTVEGISNPNYNTIGFVDIAVLDSQMQVTEFINDAFSVETIQGGLYAPLVELTSSKNQILVKSDYEMCIEVSYNIPLGSTIIVDFPRQFDLRKDSYSCYKGTNHDNSVLVYPSSILTCTTYKHLKRVEISGQTNDYIHAGAPKKICYKIADIENAKDTGQSFHFNLRVMDIKLKKILYKSTGILRAKTTLFYLRSGLRIFVDDIPDIPIGTMSNDITITLEKPVPYDVTLIPTCLGFTFIPSTIVFKFYEGQSQKFRVSPNPTSATAGTFSISWVKQEAPGQNRFSEMTDTFFKVKALPDYRELKLTLSQNVYRASVGAVSMPIFVYLSHPASSQMTLFYKTKKPFQAEFVRMTPDSIVFEPGEKVKMFNYKTSRGAVSGLIELQLQPEFRDIYYLPTPEINFEIEDIDSVPPTIEEYKVLAKAMKSVKMRISSSESAKIYYLCSIKGTTLPSVAELKDPAVRATSLNKPRGTEIQGTTFAEITSQTSTYIYNDAYINIDGLTSDREYVLYVMAEDLSGNVGKIEAIDFKTNPTPPSASFKLKTSAAIDPMTLKQALSVVSGVTTDKFVITYTPAFSSVSTIEPEVASVLQKNNLEYEVMILPEVNYDSTSPYDLVKKIEEEKETLFDELPSLDKKQVISETAREVIIEKQAFTYKPILTHVTNFEASFKCSLYYTGTVYGVILPQNAPAPSAIQVKEGLTGVNRQVFDKNIGKVKLTIDQNKKYQIQPADTITFTFLYHSSNYVAYFIGERDTYGDPILMEDSEVQVVKIKTLREIFRVEDTVVELIDRTN